MPRHLISDAHEWINEIPTVPIYYLAKPQPRERAWDNQRGKKTLLSLTSGKGLALRVGYRGPCSDVRAEQKLLDAFWWIVDSCMARIAGQGTPLGAFPCAVNNQLITGADKGNPTV